MRRKLKKALKNFNRFEKQMNRDLERMFCDRNHNGVISLEEVGKNYFSMFREAQRVGKWRRQARWSRRKRNE